MRGNTHVRLGRGLGETERIERPPARLEPTHSRRPTRRQRRRPGPPRRVQPPRPLCHRRGQMNQRHALQPAQGHRQTDHRAAAQARLGRNHQQTDVPRVPALRRASLHLQAAQRRGRRAPRRVALLDISLAAETVRQARPHDPQTQSQGVLAAVELGISNGRLEALTARSGSCHTALTDSTPPTR
jgi:hypothetical protein